MKFNNYAICFCFIFFKKVSFNSLGPLRNFFQSITVMCQSLQFSKCGLVCLFWGGFVGFFYEIEYSCISCKLLVEFDPNDIFHLSDIKHFIDMQCKVDSFFVREQILKNHQVSPLNRVWNVRKRQTLTCQIAQFFLL